MMELYRNLTSIAFRNQTRATSSNIYPEFYKLNRAWDVWDVSILVLFLVGLVGNTLTIIVFRRKSMRNNNEAIFLTTMSIADILFLTIKFIANVQKLYHIPIYKFCPYLQHVLPQALAWIAPWLIVMITVERTYAVMEPLRVASVFTKRLCFISIVAIWLFFSLLSSSQAICVDYFVVFPYFCRIKGPHGGTCYLFMMKFFPWLKSALMSWIPGGVALVLNSVIIYCLYRAKKKRMIMTNSVREIPLRATSDRFMHSQSVQSFRDAGARKTLIKKRKLFKLSKSITSLTMLNSRSDTERRMLKEKQLTFRLCVISVIFVILTLPYSAFDLLRKIGLEWRILKNRDAQRAVLFLLDCMHATNFIVYSVTGERFRRSLTNTLLCNFDRPAMMKSFKLVSNKMKRETSSNLTLKN